MVNNAVSANAKENFKFNYIIYIALFSSLIAFLLFALYISAYSNKADENLLNVFMFVVPAFAVLEIFMSRFMYHKISQQNSSTFTLLEKLGKYRTAKIVSWAGLEAAGLFSAVAIIITNSKFFLIVFFVIIVAFILSKPSQDEFINDFKIEGEDRNEFL